MPIFITVAALAIVVWLCSPVGSIWRVVARVLAWPRVADWIIRFAQRHHVGVHIPDVDSPTQRRGEYMRRWWLLNPLLTYGGKPKYPWLPIMIRVHHIQRADGDRHLHDHPFSWRTIVLKGGYWEERASGNGLWFRAPGDTVKMDATTPHRIAEVTEGGVYTLFICGRRVNSWGFYTPKGKVGWREYLGEPEVE